MKELEVLEEDLKVVSKALEWEMGDIWGHVGARLPSGEGVTVKMFRKPEAEGIEDWVIRFDYSMKKLSGIGRPPTEAAIYTEIFKVRPDVQAIIHSHAPMCVALSLANQKIDAIHMQSSHFTGGVDIYPKPIFIIDEDEGKDLARALGKSDAIVIRGHGPVLVGRSVGEVFTRALYLERTAKIHAFAVALGFKGPDPEFRRYMAETKKKHQAYLKERRGEEAAEHYYAEWRYYKDKVQKGELWNRGVF